MAEKDWKLVEAGIIGWENIKKRILVRIGKEKGEFYNVLIIALYGNQRLEDKYFKTKQEALKFARSYMKQN